MSLQQLGMPNNQIVHGRLVDPAGAQVIRETPNGESSAR